MNANQLPTPGTLLTAVLAFLSVPAGVTSLITLVAWLWNWGSAVKTTAKSLGSVRGFAGRVTAMKPVRKAGALAVLVLIPCAQALLLGLWYLIGEGLSLWLDPSRAHTIANAIREEGYTRALRLGDLDRLPPMTALTAACVTVCLGVLLVAYQRAAAGHSVEMLSRAFAVLGSVLLLAALTVLTIDILIEPAALTDTQLAAGIRPSRGEVILDMLSIMASLYAMVILTKLASRVGVRGTHMVIGAWNGSGPPLTVRDLTGDRLLRGW